MGRHDFVGRILSFRDRVDGISVSLTMGVDAAYGWLKVIVNSSA